MQAEIIAIGTELLLGNTLDTNTQFLAILMRRLGVDVYRTMIVGDNADRIAVAVQECLSRAEIVITTGGLGPTIDDATREGVAKALNLELEFQPQLWDQIQARFRRFKRRPTENNRRQAFIPQGAVALENPVGTAPAFFIESGEQLVISLPGVPAELTYLAQNELTPLLQARGQGEDVILTRHIRTAGIGESWLDQNIQDLEQGRNPTVGLSAQPGRVDIRITAKAKLETSAQHMLDEVEEALKQRLGDHIYGDDADTLESAVENLLNINKLRAVIGLVGFKEQGRIPDLHGLSASSSLSLETLSSISNLREAAERLTPPQQDRISLAVQLHTGQDQSTFSIGLLHHEHWKERQRSYGGAPEYAQEYAFNYALDTLRRYLLDNQEPPAL